MALSICYFSRKRALEAHHGDLNVFSVSEMGDQSKASPKHSQTKALLPNLSLTAITRRFSCYLHWTLDKFTTGSLGISQ